MFYTPKHEASLFLWDFSGRPILFAPFSLLMPHQSADLRLIGATLTCSQPGITRGTACPACAGPARANTYTGGGFGCMRTAASFLLLSCSLHGTLRRLSPSSLESPPPSSELPSSALRCADHCHHSLTQVFRKRHVRSPPVASGLPTLWTTCLQHACESATRPDCHPPSPAPAYRLLSKLPFC